MSNCLPKKSYSITIIFNIFKTFIIFEKKCETERFLWRHCWRTNQRTELKSVEIVNSMSDYLPIKFENNTIISNIFYKLLKIEKKNVAADRVGDN